MGAEEKEIGKANQIESIEYPGIRGKAIKKVGSLPEQKEWHDRKREPVG